jgi:lysophospholipase L1-like esterase
MIIARSHGQRLKVILGVLIGLSAGAVGAGLALQTYWLERPVGAGPAGPPVPRAPFARVWSRRPVVLLGVGDSITAGFGASDPARSYFRRLIAPAPGDPPELEGIGLKYVFPRLTARNLAVPGSTSLQHLSRQILPLKPYPPDTLGLVVMTTGGNDLIHDYGHSPPREGAMFGATLDRAKPWVRNFEIRLESMVRHLKRTFPGGCQIFLASIYDPTDGTGTAWSVGLPRWRDAREVHLAYNEAIQRCTVIHPYVHLVNTRDAFLGHGITCRQFWRRSYRPDDPYYWYADNFEDPNDRGYDALRRLFLIEMAEVSQGSEIGGQGSGGSSGKRYRTDAKMPDLSF